jgi:hydroxymethylbilane synthase
MQSTSWMKIGTRGSPLALAQAHQIRNSLAKAHGLAADAIEVVVIRTTGDMIQDRALSEAGGKGLFTKELDIAMIEGRIDIAVHSSKDLPTILPPNICVAGYADREDVRDVFIGKDNTRLRDLPQGARVGTASLRRGAMVKNMRPDIEIGLLRGNVQTRLNKVQGGEVDGTLLALAGLKRLGLTQHATEILDEDTFLPAVGQGAIGITARSDDDATLTKLAAICHAPTGIALTTERAFLRVLDGSCRTPIAGLARVTDGKIAFRGMILRKDGSQCFDISAEAAAADAEALGEDCGRKLLARAPADIFS